ncbi:MAG: YihY/virulence factor BrkB family protein [Phycisphaerales bacterium]|nr:MAG: YihY/virulence factor BrkB family protein [Phycisphaerales bacterium]
MIKDAGKGWADHRAPQIAAALAFFTVFSLAPVLIIVIAVAGMFYGERLVQQEIIEQFAELVGEEAAGQVQVVIENASQPRKGIIASLIGFSLMIIGATAVFKQLKDGMNIVWSVERAEGRIIWRTVKDRLLSLAMVLAVAFILLVSLVLSAGINAVSNMVDGWLPEAINTISITHTIVSLVIITLLFASIFKILPEIKIRWTDVLPGAFVTAILFSIGKSIVGGYLGGGGVASVYGAAGAFVIILLWVYYSALIVLFGAELTHAWTRRYGSLSPKKLEAEAAAASAPSKPAEHEPSPGSRPDSPPDAAPEDDSIPLADPDNEHPPEGGSANPARV